MYCKCVVSLNHSERFTARENKNLVLLPNSPNRNLVGCVRVRVCSELLTEIPDNPKKHTHQTQQQLNKIHIRRKQQNNRNKWKNNTIYSPFGHIRLQNSKFSYRTDVLFTFVWTSFMRCFVLKIFFGVFPRVSFVVFVWRCVWVDTNPGCVICVCTPCSK